MSTLTRQTPCLCVAAQWLISSGDNRLWLQGLAEHLVQRPWEHHSHRGLRLGLGLLSAVLTPQEAIKLLPQGAFCPDISLKWVSRDTLLSKFYNDTDTWPPSTHETAGVAQHYDGHLLPQQRSAGCLHAQRAPCCDGRLWGPADC